MAEEPRDDIDSYEEKKPDGILNESDIAAPESTGDEALDRQLSRPVIEGMQGIDTAQVWIAGFLIVVAGLIAYSNAFGIPFHYLDQRVIVDNPHAHSVATVPQALDVEPSSPLPMLTYAVNWAISGDSPVPFHIVNIFLHALNALMVYLICRRLMPEGIPEPVSMLAGLFVALNPLTTESVNYAVGRAELMAAFFTLAAVVFFMRGTSAVERPRIGSIAMSLLAMIGAWYCSPVALLIPLLVFAIDWVQRGIGAFRWPTVHGAYWALAGLLLVSWIASLNDHAQFDQLVGDAPQATNADRALAFMRGIEKTLSPVGLTPDHNLPPHGARSFLEDQTVHVGLSVMNGLVLVVAAIVLVGFRSVTGIALLWFTAGLVAATFSFTAANPFSERALYFPLCGIVLVVPWLVAKASARRATQIAAVSAAVVLLIAAGSGTYLRNRVWQSPQSLWEDAGAKNPNNPLPLERLGEVLFDQATQAYQESALLAQEGQGPAASARREESMQLFSLAEETLIAASDANPDNPATLDRLGQCASFRGRVEIAQERFRQALWLDPVDFGHTSQLAMALTANATIAGNMSDRLLAIDYFRRAEELGPLPPEMRTQFAVLLTSIGDLEAAEEELTAVVEASEYTPATQQLEVVRRTRNVLSDADRRARQILDTDPSSADGLRLHAEVLMGRGMLLQASYVLARLLRQNPDDLDSWVLQGAVRAMVNDEPRFLSEWPKAPAPEPGAPSGWVQLAQRCAAAGRWTGARTYLEAAAGRAPDVSLPLVTLAEIALSMNLPATATPYLEEAAETYPDSPRAWLLLADVAIGSENFAAAQRYLDEAEKRGASASELEPRRARIGDVPAPDEPDGFETILR
ncbi:MAG: hypothetical protein AMXMBFR82_35490 [Candidatus Hydrogenedentota bacterium]